MINFIESLAKWRKDRHITKSSGKYYHMIGEELKEYIEAIKANNEHEIIDAIADIIVLSVNELELIGYDTEKVMQEVVKEISSRKQDPKQANRNWSGEKWQKDRNQNKSTLYKADFSKSKL